MPRDLRPPFDQHFGRWARRVRGWLVGRQIIAGAAAGLMAAPALAIVCWWSGRGGLRPWTVLAAGVGALVGLVYGLLRRWSDVEVALYLDAKLAGDELLSAALSVSPPAPVELEQRAGALLERSDPRRARPRIWRRWHLLAPVGLLAVAAVSLAQLPARPAVAEPQPGQQVVTRANLTGLEPIIALERLDARDEAQKERLRQIAEAAKRLRTELARGVESRDALARVAKLRDEIAAERLRFGDEQGRAGLEAAVRKLENEPATRNLARALGLGDLTEFDREMQQLASQAERASRSSAREMLAQAEREARARGAGKLADYLEQEQRLFTEREGKAAALRELAHELGAKLTDEARRELEEFGTTGDPKAQARLSQALEKALLALTEEERQRLAQNLKKRLEQPGAAANPMTAQQLQELVRKLATPSGQQQLREALRELARPTPSREARRNQGLDDADRGGADAQRELGAVPLPTESPGAAGSALAQGKPGANDPASPGPGSHHDYGTGPHQGKTDPIAADALRAKAHTSLDPSAPMQGTSLGRAPARAGETASRASTGALGTARSTEISGVERSEIPEEYREQVGRYFSP